VRMACNGEHMGDQSGRTINANLSAECSARGWTRRVEARTGASASLAIALGDTLAAVKACAREGSLSI
jgi:hypothetical protein